MIIALENDERLSDLPGIFLIPVDILNKIIDALNDITPKATIQSILITGPPQPRERIRASIRDMIRALNNIENYNQIQFSD